MRRLAWLGISLAFGLSAPAVLAASDAGAPPQPEQATPEAAPEERAAPEKPRAMPRLREHRVASGDTLIGIAQRYGVRVASITAANGIGKDAPLRIGQKLVIPAPGQTVTVGRRTHVVGAGDTLGKIAHRYDLSIEALGAANGLRRNDPIKIGQKLTIPAPRQERGEARAESPPSPRGDEAPHEPAASDRGLQRLEVPGAPPAYYYEPVGPGRLSLRPVIMYLHGRGGVPADNCRQWARVARRFGWVVCPQGPEDRGGGKRGWSNNWLSGHRIALATLNALRKKYGRRVQLYGNTLIGFSEGAFVAMNVGVREARAFNRWLILAANSDYWGPSALEQLARQRGRIRRVYLITGQQDEVYEEAKVVKRRLSQNGIAVRVSTPKDLGHEIPLSGKASMYKAALHWLEG